MAQDITLPIEDGYFNLRVGAIILKNGRVLMVGSDAADYVYTVGGRVHFGESLEDAVRREVLEETGVRLEVERLGFVQEDFFLCDLPSKLGKVIHELGFYFYMKTPEDFEPICRSLAADGSEERLEWVPLDSERRAYPSFFFSELSHPSPFVRHFVTKEL